MDGIDIMTTTVSIPREEPSDMKCTANTRPEKRGPSHRCERDLGHPGLHRYTLEWGDIQEFPDTAAFFPHYRPEEREAS